MSGGPVASTALLSFALAFLGLSAVGVLKQHVVFLGCYDEARNSGMVHYGRAKHDALRREYEGRRRVTPPASSTRSGQDPAN